MDEAAAATVTRVPLSVLHVCLPRECDGVRRTATLAWGMDETWRARGMRAVHVVHVWRPAQPTCHGRVWRVGCEE